MGTWLGERVRAQIERRLRRSIADRPRHIAVIQDGNRRYARERGAEPSTGHRQGAETTERLLRWCDELGIEELTVYAFSTENFDRPPAEREALFDLIASKLRTFADADDVHDREVRIRAIGDRSRLPARVGAAVRYAERRTREYDRVVLTVALAYGGRAQLLGAARRIAREVARGDLAPDAIDGETIEARLHDQRVRDVDLVIRTGGDERTSNFLPWHAIGNEAAVYFCSTYWPEFRRRHFLRAIRLYEARETSWRRTQARRARALRRRVSDADLTEAQATLARDRDRTR